MTTQQAHRLGKQAHAEGRMSAPILDATISKALEGKAVGDPDSKKIMRAFSKGYNEAADEAWRSLQ